MENTVIKSLTPEHGAKVIEWWKSQGVDTGGFSGVICESNEYESIYYGVINDHFENYSKQYVDRYNAKIIELPEEEFDMTTNEGRLAYAKKHYPIGTKYMPIDSIGKLYYNNAFSTYEPILWVAGDGKDIEVGNGLIYHHDTKKWAKIIKQEEKMETQKLSRKGLKEIHSVACGNWKLVLEKHGTRNPLEDYIELTQEEVDNMFKACTSTQLPIVSKYLKQDDGSVDVTEFTASGKGFFYYNFYIIRDREQGEYKSKSFLLSEQYNWEIKKDEFGQLCLIPTKKK